MLPGQPSTALFHLSKKRFAVNLRHQIKAKRAHRLSAARHFTRSCVQVFRETLQILPPEASPGRPKALPDEFLVGRFIHVIVHLAQLAGFDLEKPRIAHGVVIHLARLVDKRFVHLGDLTIQGGQNITRGLDAFDHHGFVILGHFRAHFGQFHEYHIAQLLAGVFGDPHDHYVTLNAQPFVFFGKFHRSLPNYQRLKFAGVKGRAATVTGWRLPRTSPNNCVPSAARRLGTYPIDIGPPSVGPKAPEVTVPIGAPPSASAKISVPSRIGARPSGRRPTRLRGAPFSNWSRMTSAPGKPPSRSPPLRRTF